MVAVDNFPRQTAIEQRRAAPQMRDGAVGLLSTAAIGQQPD